MAFNNADLALDWHAALPALTSPLSRYMQDVGIAEQMPMQDGSLLQRPDMQKI